jgi:multidrug efflux pump subunit AcrB
MKHTLSSWSIRNPIATIVVFGIIMLIGLSAFPNLGVDENPNIDLPAISIIALQHGANPVELESQVTKQIEDAVSPLANIEDLISTVGEGVSQTTINFNIGTNTDRVLNDARNAIEKIKDKLPQNLDQIIVERIDYVGHPFATYTISSAQRSIEDLSWMVDNTISKKLMSAPGVGRVERSGGADPEIKVEMDATRMNAV